MIIEIWTIGLTYMMGSDDIPEIGWRIVHRIFLCVHAGPVAFKISDDYFNWLQPTGTIILFFLRHAGSREDFQQ